MSAAIQRPLLGHVNALAELEDLPAERQESFLETCEEIRQLRQPTEHNQAEPLSGHRDMFRIREGRWRALAEKHMGRIRILVVAHRERIYSKIEVADRRSNGD